MMNANGFRPHPSISRTLKSSPEAHFDPESRFSSGARRAKA